MSNSSDLSFLQRETNSKENIKNINSLTNIGAAKQFKMLKLGLTRVRSSTC